MSQSLSISSSALKELSSNKAVSCVFQSFPESRVVGGAVRDILLGLKPKDIDMAAPLNPKEMMEALRKQGVAVIPTGLAHGTITVVKDKDHVELTSLRKDVDTDGRHAQVAWTKDWKEDAARRDFTINALSMDQKGHIFDYFDGQEDLKSGLVRFVGDAPKRIEEDGLRILRFFRFYGRFSKKEADHDAIRAIEQGLSMLDVLSAERIASEVEGILSHKSRADVAELMEKSGVWKRIFKPANVDMLKSLDPSASYLTCLIALFDDSKIGKRLKLSNKASKFLVDITKDTPSITASMDDAALRRALFVQPKETLIARMQLAQAESPQAEKVLWKDLIDKVESMDVPQFHLLGADVKALGVTEGPEIGRHLDAVRKWWLDGGAIADKEACLKQLKDHVG